MNQTLDKKPSLRLPSPTFTECALFILVACLYFMILMNFQLLPIHNLFANNSDGLFIEDVARSLNAGGNTFDWRLTQAPYLFPDIFVARLLLVFDIAVGKVATYYHAFFGVIVCLFMAGIARAMNARAIFPVLSCAALYATSYIGGLFGDSITLYFGLLGFHSGIAIPLLTAVLLSIYYFKNNAHHGLLLMGIFVATFAGVISDSLVALAMVPFSALFIFACWINKELSFTRAAQYVGTLLAAVAAGKLYGYTVPFPQDREFMAFIITLLPNSSYAAIKLFPKLFIQAATESRLSLAIFIAYVLSFIIALRYLIYTFKSDRKFYEPHAFLSFFIIIAPLFVVITQVGMGVFVSIDSSRQWAPTIFLAIVFGNIIAAQKYNTLGKLLQAVYILGAALLLVYSAKALTANNSKVSEDNQFDNFIACMASHELPKGSFYVGDYWLARPIRMYSSGDYSVSPFNMNLNPFANASNVKASRKATPEFIIAGYSIVSDDVAKRFGAPQRTLCKMLVNGAQVEIMDYANNPEVKAYLRAEAAKTY